MTRRPLRALLRRCSCALLATLTLAGSASAGDTLLGDVSRAVLGGRYLSPSGGCTPGDRDLLGWPADRLTRCRYEVTDIHRDGSRRSKAGIVYLANPSPERVLAWLESACRRADPADVEGCVRDEALAIRVASGAQFPVAGLVWEDQACGSPLGSCHGGSDGINEGYVFRNGVTVRVAGYANGSTDPVDDALLERLAMEQEATGIRRTGGYARILSTSREQYAAFTRRPGIPVGEGTAGAAIAWSDLVGDLYRRALSDDENPLITASVCSHKNMPQGCMVSR